jgi:hypothetical protein
LNGILEDISGTKLIPFLALKHYMATALVNFPAGPERMAQRKLNVLHSLELWGQFLEQLERLEFLSKEEEMKEYHNLVESNSNI